MHSTQFHELYTQLVVDPLTTHGFRRVKNSLHFEENQCILSLILQGGGGMNRDRCWDVSIGIRHRFVRRVLDLAARNDFQFNLDDYPIKIGPLRNKHRNVSEWKYSTNLRGFPGSYGTDGLWYGDRISDEEVKNDLRKITTTVLGYGMDMMRAFDPQTAARVISDHGSQAWCEIMWLEDYRAYLSKAEQDVPPNA